MGAAYFYQLTQGPLERTLPALLGKARHAGWRVAVRGSDNTRMAWLDEQLWLGPEDGFLPHGLASDPNASDQPILLGTDDITANNPACLMVVDGADVSADDVNAMERVCVIFDGNNDVSLNSARGQWKALTDAGCAAQYWSEESGRWEKKAEKG